MAPGAEFSPNDSPCLEGRFNRATFGEEDREAKVDVLLDVCYLKGNAKNKIALPGRK